MKIHTLKTHHEYFQAMWDCIKGFDIRKNDRNFQEGDVVYFEEWDPETKTYAGRKIKCSITYVFSDKEKFLGLPDDICVLGISVYEKILYLTPDRGA